MLPRLFADRFDPCGILYSMYPYKKPRRRRQPTEQPMHLPDAPSGLEPAASASNPEQPLSAAQETADESSVVHSLQVKHLQLMASELGFFLQQKSVMLLELALAIEQRLLNREGGLVFQSAAFHIPGFPRMLAEELFPQELIIQEMLSDKVSTWRAESLPNLRTMLAEVLTSSPKTTGLSRALQKPSERVIRVIAMLIPDLEISWVRESCGREKLFVNFMYILADEDGELHLPKDSQRREIQISAQEMRGIRREVLADVLLMSTEDKPLSAAFYRQLGMEDKAQEVEALLAARRHQYRRGAVLPPSV